MHRNKQRGELVGRGTPSDPTVNMYSSQNLSDPNTSLFRPRRSLRVHGPGPHERLARRAPRRPGRHRALRLHRSPSGRLVAVERIGTRLARSVGRWRPSSPEAATRIRPERDLHHPPLPSGHLPPRGGGKSETPSRDAGGEVSPPSAMRAPPPGAGGRLRPTSPRGSAAHRRAARPRPASRPRPARRCERRS